ncbi:MAG: LysR family transcriptional regulator [Pseudomonadota bacterium]
MNRYEEMETFVRTVEAGSFTAAAAQLGVAKSVVSRRVHELEQRLDVQLMVRSTRKLSLTDEGQTLYERAVVLLLDWEDAETSAGNQHSALQGSIRISVPLSFGIAHIGPALLSFQRNHPSVSIDIEFTDRKVDLIAEGFDIAIRIGELPDSNMIAKKLTAITTAAVASQQYLEQFGTPATAQDLKNHAELRFGLRARKSWPYTTPDGQHGEIEMTSMLRANSGDFLLNAAIEHHGVAILPRFISYPALQSGALVEVLPDHRFSALNAYALYPSSKHLPRRIRLLVDHLSDRCGSGTPPWDQPLHS